MTSIAFVTTCRKRLHHIQQTLPILAGSKADEVILVDYGCPDNSGDWVEANHPAVKVVRVTDDPDFCAARARNMGAAAASAEWLVMIDGDILIQPEWLDWMQENLKAGEFYRPALTSEKKIDPETYGTFICRRADFEAVEGYDEIFRGWGGEDDDLYRRLIRRGIVQSQYPSRFVSAIHHDNNERAGWDGISNKKDKLLLNQLYMMAKMQAIHANGGRQLPMAIRQNLMASTRQSLTRWLEEGAEKPLTIKYKLAQSKLNAPAMGAFIESELSFTLNVRRDPPGA